jgi:hypothetical protein
VTFKWVYHPSIDSHFLMGPWTASLGGVDYNAERQYAHITVGAGGVHWACLNSTDPPVKFFNVDEAKAYLIAMVRLT